MDLYFTEDGDVSVSHTGDLEVTGTPWRDDIQQIYLRVMTDVGDFVLYPQLGANLSQLYGLPQSPATGELGQQMIRSALEREGRFVGSQIRVKSVPTGPQSIRFDIDVKSNNKERPRRLSVEQDVSVTQE